MPVATVLDVLIAREADLVERFPTYWNLRHSATPEWSEAAYVWTRRYIRELRDVRAKIRVRQEDAQQRQSAAER